MTSDPTKEVQVPDGLTEAVPCLVYLFDIAERRTVYTNRQVAADLGFSAAEIYDLGPELLISLMHPDDLARISDLFARWQHAHDHESLAAEYRLRDASGRWRPFVGRDRVFRRDADGQVTQIVGVALDVTLERGAERIGGEPRRALDTLIGNLPGMAYRCANDQHWSMEFVSDGSLELTGYPASALIQNSQIAYGDLIVPEDRDAVWKAVQEADAERRPFVIAYRIQTADGDLRWVWEKGRGVYADDGELEAIEGFITDITERRRLEEQAVQTQKLESLGVLAGGIAHDFNNLLTAIVGNVTMARRAAGDDPQQREHLAKAERACAEASSLTKRLLTFAAGGAPIKEATSVVQLVRDCVGLALAGSTSRASIEAPVDPCMAQIDPGQMAQVINNLLINAVQAMPDGGLVHIEVSVEGGEKGESSDGGAGGHVSIRMRDHGRGIKPEDLPRVCDPFFTTKAGASGLGLATSYRILHAHGGDLSVASVEGEGTTVTCRLPASSSAAPLEEPLDDSEPEGRGRVLVMDDEELILDVVSALIGDLGYEVLTARDGAEAVQCYQEALEQGRPIDAVVLDLTVPGGMGGKEAMAWLRDIDPGVRALVSSGYSQDPVMAAPESYGFLAVVPKPYRSQDLAKAIRTALDAPL